MTNKFKTPKYWVKCVDNGYHVIAIDGHEGEERLVAEFDSREINRRIESLGVRRELNRRACAAPAQRIVPASERDRVLRYHRQTRVRIEPAAVIEALDGCCRVCPGSDRIAFLRCEDEVAWIVGDARHEAVLVRVSIDSTDHVFN